MSAINLVQMAFEMADCVCIETVLCEAYEVHAADGAMHGSLAGWAIDDEPLLWLRERGLLTSFDPLTGNFSMKALATCAGCGCTDDHACEGGCSWLAVDYAAGTGVCDNCPEHLNAWRAAFKVPETKPVEPRRVTVREITSAVWASDAICPEIRSDDAEVMVGLAMRRVGLFLVGQPGTDVLSIDLENGYELRVTAKKDTTAAASG